jgi:hypothetical protein
MKRPSERDGMARDVPDLPFGKSEIFLIRLIFGLDMMFRKSELICPSGSLVGYARFSFVIGRAIPIQTQFESGPIAFAGLPRATPHRLCAGPSAV